METSYTHKSITLCVRLVLTTAACDRKLADHKQVSPSGAMAICVQPGKPPKYFRSDAGMASPLYSRKRRKKPEFYDCLEVLPAEATAGLLPIPGVSPRATQPPPPESAPNSYLQPASKYTAQTSRKHKMQQQKARKQQTATVGAPSSLQPPAREALPAESAARTTAASPTRFAPAPASSVAPMIPPARQAQSQRAPAGSKDTRRSAAELSGVKRSRKRKPKRKTLTTKGKRAAVLKIVKSLVPGESGSDAGQQNGQTGATKAAPGSLPAVLETAPAEDVPAAALLPHIPQPLPPSTAAWQIVEAGAPPQQLPGVAAPAAHVRPGAGPLQAIKEEPDVGDHNQLKAVPSGHQAALNNPQPLLPPAVVVAGAVAGRFQAVDQGGSGAESTPTEWTCNLGKAWSQEDITTLAKLATDREYLREAIPQHPASQDLDWELIGKHLGRYSKGGGAVQGQYRLVMRTMKEARHEGRKGANYVDLVKDALSKLPGRRGTVFDIQKLLKRDHSSYLDKYRSKDGALRWKKAVGEVLRQEKLLFEGVDKSAGGKIVWRLKAS